MTLVRTVAAIAVLVSTASCADNGMTDSYGMPRISRESSIYERSKPGPMDPTRKIDEQDCTKPVVVDQGNLLCK